MRQNGVTGRVGEGMLCPHLRDVQSFVGDDQVLVKSVEFIGKKLINRGHAVSATVLLHDEVSVLSLACRAPVHEGEGEGAHFAGLLSDAVRQISLMPDFRLGKKKLRFAPDALSARRLQAA